jgi:acetylornithine deacetylase/succinyl-diaminopimelate desuccinylase-like protein
MSNAKQALNYFQKNKNQFLKQLYELVEIPSISFDGYSRKTLEASAKKTAELMKKAGLENIKTLKIKKAPPYVYGDWLNAGPKAPTLLLYAHHDVQPPMREELWKTPPFKPTIKNGRLYGRGAADDKGGIILHLASIASYLKTSGKLPINIKVIIEGEEEVGSEHLLDFLKKHKKMLQADAMILADAANFDTGVPSLTTSLRGLIALQIETKVMDHPLHSGLWGGPIPDPVMALSKILAGLTDENGEINIPAIKKMVKPLSSLEKKSLASLKLSPALLKKQAQVLGSAKLSGKNGSELLQKLWRRPSLVINAIEAGGRKIAGNVLMDSAWTRIGLRTVPNMNNKKAYALMVKKIKELTPWGVEVKITPDSIGNHWSTDISHPIFKTAAAALKKGFKHETAFIGCGASIPFTEPFSKALGGVPVLLLGVEDPYTNAHSENESLHLGDFYKTIESQIYLFDLLKGA